MDPSQNMEPQLVQDPIVEKQMGRTPNVTDDPSSTDAMGIDPVDALDLSAGHDTEHAIYEPQTLFGQVHAWMGESDEVQQEADSLYSQGLKNQGHSDRAVKFGNENPYSPDTEAFSNGKELEAASAPAVEGLKNLAGGAIGGAQSILDLVSLGVTEATKMVGHTLTGKSHSQLEAENPLLYKPTDLELPEWLKPDPKSEWWGPLIQGIAQYETGSTVIGALGKLSKVSQVVSGSSGALGRLTPGIRGVATAALDGAKTMGKNYLVDTTAFDGHTGNLANLVEDLTKGHPGLVNSTAKMMASHDDDPELLARHKNGMVGFYGEAAGTALFSATRLLKALGKYGKLASSEGTEALRHLQGVDELAASLEQELATVHALDKDQLMDQLFNKPNEDILAPDNVNTSFEHKLKEKQLNETIEKTRAEIEKIDKQIEKRTSELDAMDKRLEGLDKSKGIDLASEERIQQEYEDLETDRDNWYNGLLGLQNKKAMKEAALKIQEQGLKDHTTPKPNQLIHIITPEDGVEEAADKYLTASKELNGQRLKGNEEAVSEMIRQEILQGNAAFDSKGFSATLEAKIQSGEPFNIAEEILNHTDRRTLVDIDDYMARYKEILEATTKEVRRFESNANLDDRTVSVLGLDLGSETGHLDASINTDLKSAFKSLTKRGIKSLAQDEEALLEMNGLKLLEKHIIPSEMAKVALASKQAHDIGNTVLEGELDQYLRELHRNQIEARSQFVKLHSNAGRRLQAGAGAGELSSTGADFLKAVELAKSNLSTLSKDGSDLTDAELKAMKVAATELHNGKDMTVPGQAGLIGKHFLKFMGALRTHGAYGNQAVKEAFYGAVLGSYDTVKAIAWNNVALKGYEVASQGAGAFLEVDAQGLSQVRDEVEGLIRYTTEGLMAGLTVAAKGGKNAMDHTHSLPNVISAEGLRQHYGASIGDTIKQEIFGIKPGLLADRVVDLVGNVISFIPHHFIGGVDTAFKVANFRAIVWKELKARARSMGVDEYGYANTHINSVTNDLVTGRATGFSPDTPLQSNELTHQQLKSLNSQIVDDTDNVALSRPLRTGSYSDRNIFKIASSADDILSKMPVMGTWLAPFPKTFANAIQWGMDASPLTSWMSPYNQEVWQGVHGSQARQVLKGKMLLGSALATAGYGAVAADLLSPVAGSQQAKKIDNQLQGGGLYGVNVSSEKLNRIPIVGDLLAKGFEQTFQVPKGQSITFNFRRFSPQADLIFLPAKIAQIAQGTLSGDMDQGAAAYATISTAGEAFQASSFLRGMGVTLDSFLSPTYSTVDNFTRNVIIGGAGSLVAPRALRNVTRFTDPMYRDYSNLTDYIKGQLPGVSNYVSPSYDMFGNPRPADDYLGTTQTFAQNAIRSLTPLGIKYVQSDPLSDEIARFGKMGQTLQAPTKNLMYKGVAFPMDRYRDPKTGKSLWDEYNKQLNQLPTLGGRTLRENMSHTIQSEEYQKTMRDNAIVRVAGKRSTVLGSRWATIAKEYHEAIDAVNTNIRDNDSLLDTYVNDQGKTLKDDWNRVIMKQEELSQ